LSAEKVYKFIDSQNGKKVLKKEIYCKFWESFPGLDPMKDLDSILDHLVFTGQVIQSDVQIGDVLQPAYYCVSKSEI